MAGSSNCASVSFVLAGDIAVDIGNSRAITGASTRIADVTLGSSDIRLEGLMGFRIAALPRDEFAPLFTLDDEQLRARGAKRYVADRRPGFPCRVSLEDAALGEALVLVPFTHQPADTPYHASGPIFIRETARQAAPDVNEVPDQLRLRLLSLRAYDAEALMVDADVVDGRELEPVVERLLSDARVQYIHVHFARPGCYACRIDRA